MIVSPDHGGAVKARLLADILGGPSEIAIIDKSRSGPNQSTIQGVLGNVEGQDVVIIDDMIDTGGTIVKAAKHLKMAGAKKLSWPLPTAFFRAVLTSLTNRMKLTKSWWPIRLSKWRN